MFKVCLLILFSFFVLNSYSQSYVTVGLNIGIEGAVTDNDPNHNYYADNINSKSSVGITYGYNDISLGVGLSVFKENYYFYPSTRYGAQIDFEFENIGIPIELSIDFMDSENTFYLGVNNEIVYSTYAIKTKYGYYMNGNFTETIVVDKTKFSYVNFQFGLGYKVLLFDHFYAKLFTYYSLNASDKNILDTKSRFNKAGFTLGLFYKFGI